MSLSSDQSCYQLPGWFLRYTPLPHILVFQTCDESQLSVVLALIPAYLVVAVVVCSVTEEDILLQDGWLPGMNQLPKDPLPLTSSARGVGTYLLCDYFSFVKKLQSLGNVVLLVECLPPTHGLNSQLCM